MSQANPLFQMWKQAGKGRKFLIIIGGLVALWAALSFIARHTVLAEDPTQRSRIAVVAPLSGPDAAIGRSIAQGVQLYVDHVNALGGIKGHRLAATILDHRDLPDDAARQAEIAAADDRAIGVIGHWPSRTLSGTAPLYDRSGLCVLSISDTAPPETKGCPLRSLGLGSVEQARFLANYSRNVVQQKLMYLVQEDSETGDVLAQAFTEAFERFGVPIRRKWVLPADGGAARAALARLGQDLRDLPDVGAVFLAASPATAAAVLATMREAGSHLSVFGQASLASNAFMDIAMAIGGGSDGAADLVNGTTVATPLLLDTANEEAQAFRLDYQRRFGSAPDWVAAFAFDAAKAMTAGLGQMERDPALASTAERRTAVARALEGLTSAVTASVGVTGPLWFGPDRRSGTPIQVGLMNGRDIISAPVQMQPISKGAISNYIAELKAGRVLYVNNKFMYRTNVVYVGAKINEITDIDPQKETAIVDFDIWFRYSGEFSPQDIQVVNAAEPIALTTPAQENITDDITYRRYHLRKKLFLDFSSSARAYGTHVAGISFRHRTLNRTNLLYVADVLGMPTGQDLLQDVQARRVISEKSGWKPVRAWVSQEIVRDAPVGEPAYVGYGGVEPLFSRIDLGVLMYSSGFQARDFIDPDNFVYILIFALLGSIFARSMDAKRLGRYWNVQSWLMRVVFWPLLLLSAGNVALNFAFLNLSLPTVQTMDLVYSSLWWIVPAKLADMAVRRFIWHPVEERSGRRIPNVLKIVTTVVLFAFGIAGIVAFVFGQTLTSLLATSGLMAMIIGLAVQANIANLFSGIVLNIERPFKVGDFVRINTINGRVVDITWRTTRVESFDGQLISLANGKVSEAEIHNLSITPNGVATQFNVYTLPAVPPDQVLSVLRQAVEDAPQVILKDNDEFKPGVRYKGVECVGGAWVASYSVGFRVRIPPHAGKAREQIMLQVQKRFGELGIPLDLGSADAGARIAAIA
jgi:potassium efflux system protein